MVHVKGASSIKKTSEVFKNMHFYAQNIHCVIVELFQKALSYKSIKMRATMPKGVTGTV